MGVLDRLSLGSGKEVMPYLKDGSERTLSYNLALAEDGNMGHIVPGHNYLLDLVRTLLWLLGRRCLAQNLECQLMGGGEIGEE